MAVKDLWNKKARDISYAWFMIRFSSAKLVFSSAKENKTMKEIQDLFQEIKDMWFMA